MHVNGFKTCEIESDRPDESRFFVRAVVCVHAHLNPNKRLFCCLSGQADFK